MFLIQQSTSTVCKVSLVFKNIHCYVVKKCKNLIISSANAKKWEVELQTLKNNNTRLTAALQESTANVEEWKKQLAAYKDESTRMKKKVET